jgi:lipoprotein-releasing system ATP-binding protein
MAAPAPLLQVSKVSKRFDSPNNNLPLSILTDVSLEVGRGESLAIVGPSGSGKSTLLHLIGGLDQPTSGKILLDGQDLSGLTEVALAETRNRRIGFVFQAHYLLPQCTVFENVLVPTLAQPGSAEAGKAARGRAERLLKRVGLADRQSHQPGQLSGGERQRVAVVRALINQPSLLLADEPTGALDHASAQQLAQLLTELNREEDVTLIVVTHAMDLAARMGRVLELIDGHLKLRAP